MDAQESEDVLKQLSDLARFSTNLSQEDNGRQLSGQSNGGTVGEDSWLYDDMIDRTHISSGSTGDGGKIPPQEEDHMGMVLLDEQTRLQEGRRPVEQLQQSALVQQDEAVQEAAEQALVLEKPQELIVYSQQSDGMDAKTVADNQGENGRQEEMSTDEASQVSADQTGPTREDANEGQRQTIEFQFKSPSTIATAEQQKEEQDDIGRAIDPVKMPVSEENDNIVDVKDVVDTQENLDKTVEEKNANEEDKKPTELGQNEPEMGQNEASKEEGQNEASNDQQKIPVISAAESSETVPETREDSSGLDAEAAPAYPPSPPNKDVPDEQTLTFQCEQEGYKYYMDEEGRWYSQDEPGFWYYQNSGGEFKPCKSTEEAANISSSALLVPLDEDGHPTYPLNDSGKPMLPTNDQGQKVFPVGEDGNPIFPFDKEANVPTFPVGDDGQPVFPIGVSHGRPIVPTDLYDRAVFPKGSDGVHIFPSGSDGRPVAPVTVTGRPVLPLDKEGKAIVPYDAKGQPFIHLAADGFTPLTDEEYLYQQQMQQYYQYQQYASSYYYPPPFAMPMAATAPRHGYAGYGSQSMMTAGQGTTGQGFSGLGGASNSSGSKQQQQYLGLQTLKASKKVRPEDIDLPIAPSPVLSTKLISPVPQKTDTNKKEQDKKMNTVDSQKSKRLLEMQLKFSRRRWDIKATEKSVPATAALAKEDDQRSQKDQQTEKTTCVIAPLRGTTVQQSFREDRIQMDTPIDLIEKPLQLTAVMSETVMKSRKTLARDETDTISSIPKKLSVEKENSCVLSSKLATETTVDEKTEDDKKELDGESGAGKSRHREDETEDLEKERRKITKESRSRQSRSRSRSRSPRRYRGSRSDYRYGNRSSGGERDNRMRDYTGRNNNWSKREQSTTSRRDLYDRDRHYGSRGGRRDSRERHSRRGSDRWGRRSDNSSRGSSRSESTSRSGSESVSNHGADGTGQKDVSDVDQDVDQQQQQQQPPAAATYQRDDDQIYGPVQPPPLDQQTVPVKDNEEIEQRKTGNNLLSIGKSKDIPRRRFREEQSSIEPQNADDDTRKTVNRDEPEKPETIEITGLDDEKKPWPRRVCLETFTVPMLQFSCRPDTFERDFVELKRVFEARGGARAALRAFQTSEKERLQREKEELQKEVQKDDGPDTDYEPTSEAIKWKPVELKLAKRQRDKTADEERVESADNEDNEVETDVAIEEDTVVVDAHDVDDSERGKEKDRDQEQGRKQRGKVQYDSDELDRLRQEALRSMEMAKSMLKQVERMEREESERRDTSSAPESQTVAVERPPSAEKHSKRKSKEKRRRRRDSSSSRRREKKARRKRKDRKAAKRSKRRRRRTETSSEDEESSGLESDESSKKKKSRKKWRKTKSKEKRERKRQKLSQEKSLSRKRKRQKKRRGSDEEEGQGVREGQQGETTSDKEERSISPSPKRLRT